MSRTERRRCFDRPLMRAECNRAPDKHYTRVTRYTTSNFLRMKLGDALQQRGVAPHIYESAQEALDHLDRPKPAAVD